LFKRGARFRMKTGKQGKTGKCRLINLMAGVLSSGNKET